MFSPRIFSILITFLLSFPVFSEDIEEIVVTALKRSSTVVDTPASITAIGSNEIEDKGITNLKNIKNQNYDDLEDRLIKNFVWNLKN